MERENWIKRDTMVTDCVGKFDATACQLDGLRNRVGTGKLLWSDQIHFYFVVMTMARAVLIEV